MVVLSCCRPVNKQGITIGLCSCTKLLRARWPERSGGERGREETGRGQGRQATGNLWTQPPGAYFLLLGQTPGIFTYSLECRQPSALWEHKALEHTPVSKYIGF